MYDTLPSFILGFHGCDHDTAERVFAGKISLQPSRNSYDWLGHGIYFWENNPHRARQWAQSRKIRGPSNKSRVRVPAVIGAVIDLGRCLNLLDAQFIGSMKEGYETLNKLHTETGTELPKNKSVGTARDLLLRHLDCAVVEMVHRFRLESGLPEFQSVRGVFVEGSPIYPGAGVHEFNHIQVCVRDPRCIKGYFRVLDDAHSPKIAWR
jgi:hypothetical protein